MLSEIVSTISYFTYNSSFLFFKENKTLFSHKNKISDKYD